MTQVTNTVRFVLDGHIVEARGERRTTTVLDYLREQMHRTGTKEGCAEGDCGACVVMVGSLNDTATGVDYVAVNSCLQLLPTLDGKSVKTVESLQRADGTLHPVQQAMVSCHGSQCGFCTPGIVMSLVNLVQRNTNPDRQTINDTLSGNLCRCTGYKPIVDAAQHACQAGAALKIDDSADIALLKEIQRDTQPTLSLEGEIIVQPVVRTRKGNEFVSPATLAEVAHYLVEHPRATLLAGSTEIGLQVNKQFSRPEHIVYLGLVPELQRIDATAQGWRIGAAVSLERGEPKRRNTSAKSGYTGQKTNQLQPGEFIEAIELPKPAAGQVFRAHKVSKRFEQDISATCSAITYRLQGGKLSGVKLAYNGLAPAPCRAPKLEAVLEGKTPADVQVADLDAAIAASFTARDGLRATWAYRSLVARNLVLEFIEQ
ncbi:MAG: xanthine dehydrogenase small subunit [Betaproteobacteria bacterium]|nr:xanthine dehydrogenase small subunit [Betaproteobacteria bacterium]